jgi:hypothetical protein
MSDIIHNKTYCPTFEEITQAIEEPGRGLWTEIHQFLQQQYKASPKQMYSICAGKPGWNYKYQKSGKALCTLYPDACGFTALVVVPETMRPVILTANPAFPPIITDMIREMKPFNHTFWLMIPVREAGTLETVKDIIDLKLKFTAEQGSKK